MRGVLIRAVRLRVGTGGEGHVTCRGLTCTYWWMIYEVFTDAGLSSTLYWAYVHAIAHYALVKRSAGHRVCLLAS